jgi:hypothetical protein
VVIKKVRKHFNRSVSHPWLSRLDLEP